VETSNLKVSGSDSGISSSTYAAGNGGSVSIKAADSVSIADGGSLSSESTDTGKAGEITIIVNNNLSLKDSSITTATANAGGGSITIDPVLVHLKNSSITTSVKGGTGNGGNIDLTAKQLVVDNSRIVAQADAGNGGNINLNADVIIQSPTGSLISASSNLGLQGSVVLSSPVLDVNAALVDMPSSLRDIASLSPRRCITTGDEISSFVVYSCGVSLRQADAAIIGK
jgi:large exoprotein involved in heme utilization and adhesion